MYHQAFSVSHVYLRQYLWLQELFLVLLCGDREGGARFDHHVLLSQEAKADVASPRLMPGLSIHMDFFVRSLGPLCTQLWIFVNFSPVCLFSAGRKQRDRQGHTNSQPRTNQIICCHCFALFKHFSPFSAKGYFWNDYLCQKNFTDESLKGDKKPEIE